MATTRGQRRDLVTFEAPGNPVPDGHGGYSYTWTPLTPNGWYVRLRPATARDAERVTAGTVLTHVSYLVNGDYHPGVTTQARMTDAAGRVYQVTSAIDVDHRGDEMELVADLQT
jgi:hypothetical protein